MTNLDAQIRALREKLEAECAHGEKENALRISQELDCLIALRQREHLLWGVHDAPKICYEK